MMILILLIALTLTACAEPDYAAQRERMVKTTVEARGVKDPLVLKAMRTVERHRFVNAEHRHLAYADRPLPLSHGQTISQPYIVAVMTELAEVRPGEKVLEIGTGSGYQAAVLAALGAEVYTIEIVEPLAKRAQKILESYEKVHVRAGDGYRGWPDQAPFDAVLLTAAPEKVPQPLLDQLAVGGRLVVPEGEAFGEQMLRVYERTEEGIKVHDEFPVMFVPMTGEAEK